MLMNFVTAVAAFIVVLGLLIFVHELGHFMAAKWFGVRVLTFSLGFGRRLIGFKRGDTDYRLSLLPFGGYVKMAGEDPSKSRKDDPGDLMTKPRWQRLIIVVMGPLMNVVWAVVSLAGLYRYHFEKPAYEEQVVRLGGIEPDSPAARAGLLPGDLIVQLDGIENPKWSDVEFKTMTAAGTSVPVEVLRNGQDLKLTVTPKADETTGAWYFGWQPCVPALIGMVEPGLPASRAGLEPGDQIVVVAGRPISCWQNLTAALRSGNGKPVDLTVLRNGRNVRSQLTPIYSEVMGVRKWRIGVGVRDVVVIQQLPWRRAITSSFTANLRNSLMLYDLLGKIIAKPRLARSLVGPIGIAEASGIAYREGISDLVAFVSLVSLNLAIINMLPMPIVDGGVILLLLIEGLMRRDLSVGFKERFAQVGIVFLLLLAVFVMYNDILRIVKPY